MNSIDRIDHVTGLCSLYDLRFVSPSLLCKDREPNVPLHKKMFWYGGGGGVVGADHGPWHERAGMQATCPQGKYLKFRYSKINSGVF